MKILITGSSGYIGYKLSKRLLELEHEVIGLDNIKKDSPNHLKEERTNELTKFKNFQFLKLGKNNKGLEPLLKQQGKIDIAIDLAAKDFYYHTTELENYSSFLETNVVGTSKIFEIATKLKVKKFIYGSSSSVYGKTKKKILTEKKLIPQPVSPHGASKYAGEKVVQFMSKYYKTPAIILRIFTEYGPGMPLYKVIGHFLEKIYYNEPFKMYGPVMNQTRDFIYIEDVVNYIIATLDKRISFQVFNIASGKSYSLKEVAQMVADEMGYKGKLKIQRSHKDFSKVTMDKVQADISKAVKMLKYKPQTDIKTGIANTVRWYLETEQFKNRYHTD